jgi:rRNA maturation protein Rpf1
MFKVIKKKKGHEIGRTAWKQIWAGVYIVGEKKKFPLSLAFIVKPVQF